MPMSSDPFEFAWSVAKSEEEDFDIDQYFLHRKGILDFIENQGELLSQRGKARRDRGLRRLGILPPLEQSLTEQPVVAIPDVGRDAGARREEKPPMDRGKVDEGPKDPRQKPEPEVGEAEEETSEVKPEDKVESPAPKEEVGMPQPPEGKPPKIEDIVKPPPKRTKNVASKPPPKNPKAESVKEPPAENVKNTASKVPKPKPKPKPEPPQAKPTKVDPPAKKKDDFKIPRFINEDTNRELLERIVEFAEDGVEEAYKALLNNSATLEDHFPDIYERYEEIRSQMWKSFILKDPFANPFHNPNFLDTIDIRREMAEPMSPIIKSQPMQTQAKPDIGFDTVEGDNLSLLPASMFMGRDNSVGMDDMSLLPTGWRNE